MAEAKSKKVPRPVWQAVLLTFPMLLWALLMMTPVLQRSGRAPKGAALVSAAFMVALFFLMVRTRETYRWRRVFFVALAFLFPVGFIYELISLRGSMSIPVEQMLGGNTPFCFLAIPMMIIPAALTRMVIFPGAILPTAANPHSVATMVGLWMVATLVLGKAWCAYGCFFGGIEEGFASLRKRPVIKTLSPILRLIPWAVLSAIVLFSLATFSPTYCSWLCPFKTVTEFPEIRNAKVAFQTVIFVTLFLALVIVLPILTKKRTQCAFFCPFGAFQSIFNKLSPFEVRIRKDACKACSACQQACPTEALDKESIAAGRALHSCMRCGACVDTCPRGAPVFHVRGTQIGGHPEAARLLFLYAGWAFATMFGGTIIAGSLLHIIQMVS